jgi:hypothetical protein
MVGRLAAAARGARGLSSKYWTTARGAPAAGARAAGVSERRRRELAAGPFAAGGQRRFLADEQKEQKKQERPGMGVLATFMKSIRDQMSAKAETDEELAAARERLELARQESLANAEKAMLKAKEAAEEVGAAKPALLRACRARPHAPCPACWAARTSAVAVCLPCSPIGRPSCCAG